MSGPAAWILGLFLWVFEPSMGFGLIASGFGWFWDGLVYWVGFATTQLKQALPEDSANMWLQIGVSTP